MKEINGARLADTIIDGGHAQIDPRFVDTNEKEDGDKHADIGPGHTNVVLKLTLVNYSGYSKQKPCFDGLAFSWK